MPQNPKDRVRLCAVRFIEKSMNCLDFATGPFCESEILSQEKTAEQMKPSEASVQLSVPHVVVEEDGQQLVLPPDVNVPCGIASVPSYPFVCSNSPEKGENKG